MTPNNRFENGWHIVWPRDPNPNGERVPRLWFWNATFQQWQQSRNLTSVWPVSVVNGAVYGNSVHPEEITNE